MKKTLLILLSLCFIISLAACGGEEESGIYTPVKWEYISGLPAGFPALSSGVTTVDESFTGDADSIALYWNLLDKSDFDGFVSKIESWAGTEFGEPAADGTVSLTVTKDGKDYTVKAAYNGSATGNYLEGNNYDSQARIEIIEHITE